MATLDSRMLLLFFALAFGRNTSLYVRVPATFVSLRDSRHTLARPGAERKENNWGCRLHDRTGNLESWRPWRRLDREVQGLTRKPHLLPSRRYLLAGGIAAGP